MGGGPMVQHTTAGTTQLKCDETIAVIQKANVKDLRNHSGRFTVIRKKITGGEKAERRKRIGNRRIFGWRFADPVCKGVIRRG